MSATVDDGEMTLSPPPALSRSVISSLNPSLRYSSSDARAARSASGSTATDGRRSGRRATPAPPAAEEPASRRRARSTQRRGDHQRPAPRRAGGAGRGIAARATSPALHRGPGVLGTGRLAHGRPAGRTPCRRRSDSDPRAAWRARASRSRRAAAGTSGRSSAIGVGCPRGLLGQHLAQVGAAEGHPAGQHLVQHAAQRCRRRSADRRRRRPAPAPGSCRPRCRSAALSR